MVNRFIEILKLALKKNATDVHFTCMKQKIQIQMRCAKGIVEIRSKPNDERLMTYLKYRANLDLSDNFEPQSGSFEEELNNQVIAMRFSCVSTFKMTTGALRILNIHSNLHLSDLTKNEFHQQQFRDLIQKKSGLILISGPTGSGKTTTLYTLLKEIKGKKIFTLEDPIEIVQENMVQIQINEKGGLGYAEGIKQLLRHDPDIIMLGEIRDSAAALMAVRAGLTGHLVFATIHSFSAESTIERMLELGVNPIQLKDVLICISNQRLYHAKRSKIICLYEFLSRKDILRVMDHEEHEEGFISIQSQAKELVEKGILDSKEVCADFV